jgi:predicted ATPase
MFIFKRSLGVLYETDYYIAKIPPKGASNEAGTYLKPNVFFDRFCFDIISLLGEHLNKLTFSDVEYIMRKVYQHSTHFVVPDKPNGHQQANKNFFKVHRASDS